MTLPISFFIALRYWRAKSADRFGRLVSNLASIGIMLGVCALIIVLSVMNGLENNQKQQVLATIPHAIISPLQGHIELSDSLPILPKEVQSAVAINSTDVILRSANAVSAGKVIGVQKETDDPLLLNFSASELQQLLPKGGFRVIISSQLAQQLKLQVGDKVRLMITENSQYTPFGRVPVQRLFTVSAVYFSPFENSTIFTELTDIGRLMRISTTQAEGYRLFLQDPFLITELSRSFPTEKWKIKDWRTQKGEFFQAVKMEKNMMGLLVSLMIIVAVSNIVTSLSLMVVDKQGEIAILQTQGLKHKQIQQIFIFQGLIVGAIGTLSGLLLGLILTLNLNHILTLINPYGIYLPIEINNVQIIMILVFSLLLSLLSTLYPAYRAAKTEPAVVLRYE